MARREPTPGRTSRSRSRASTTPIPTTRSASTTRTCRTASSLNGIWELPFGTRPDAGAATPTPVVNGLHRQLERLVHLQLAVGPAEHDDGQRLLQRRHHAAEDEVHRAIPTQPVFDTSGFYFHDAAVQTNGVDDPAKQRADQRIQLGEQHPDDPDAVGRPARPALHQLGHVVRQGAASSAASARQIHIELYNAFNDVFYNTPEPDARRAPTSARCRARTTCRGTFRLG